MWSESNPICLLLHHWGYATSSERQRLGLPLLQPSGSILAPAVHQSWAKLLFCSESLKKIDSFVGLCCICQHSRGAVHEQCSCCRSNMESGPYFKLVIIHSLYGCMLVRHAKTCFLFLIWAAVGTLWWTSKHDSHGCIINIKLDSGGS